LKRIVKNLKYFVSRSSKSVFEKLDINVVILIQLRSAARTCGPCRKQRIPAAIKGSGHTRASFNDGSVELGVGSGYQNRLETTAVIPLSKQMALSSFASNIF
jgi:hypothetical protein